jgi:hypothetical protein
MLQSDNDTIRKISPSTIVSVLRNYSCKQIKSEMKEIINENLLSAE